MIRNGEKANSIGRKQEDISRKKDAEAQLELAKHYEIGEGVNKDYTESAEWFRRADEQGHAGAKIFFGEMF